MKNSRFIFLPAIAGALSLAGFSSAQAVEDVYVSNNGGNTIEEISLSGAEMTYATVGMNGPTGLVFNSAGDLFVANNGSGTISEYNTSGNLITATFASGLSAARGLTIDSSGNLYVANQGSGVIDKIATTGPNAGVVTTFATGFWAPTGLAFNSAGDLLVTTTLEDPNTGNNYTISTIAPNGTLLTPYASGTTAAGLAAPTGISVDPLNGNVYIVNQGTGSIEEFTSGVPSSVTVSDLSSPDDVTIDTNGNLFITNLGNNTVTEYNPTTKTSSVLAGNLNYPCFITTFDTSTIPVPEPSTYALLAFGLGLILFVRHRKTANS
jgi:DNA-binding beta-propeller fold protein YncE